MISNVAHRAGRQLQGRDLSLLARAQRGDVAAFEQLAGAHLGGLFAATLHLVGDRSEAEDVMQETLLRAWKGIGRFRGRSGFSTWLHRIAVNEANRSFTKGTRRPETTPLADEQPELSSPADNGPLRHAESTELRDTVRAALLALPLPHRTAVVLRDIEGLSTRDAAHVAGIREATLKRRLHQARLKIRAELDDSALAAAPCSGRAIREPS
jgi:RNA polymerase sigma-70 factor (ECF subfamily)